jgi:basic membrane protein A
MLIYLLIASLILFAACNRDGDVIQFPDPNDAPSTAPLVTVFYDPNALGDCGYNDLIYKGVEEAAQQYGLRTMQLSPSSREEGLIYLQTMFQHSDALNDTVHRLFIVAAASYDDYLRQNNSRFEANPYIDLLYLETDTPLEGKGSTLYLPYYGAMYEAGAIAPVVTPEVLLVGANPKVKSVVDAMQGFSEGFDNSPVPEDKYRPKKLVTVWLSYDVGGGFSVPDTTAMRLMLHQEWEGFEQAIMPICGGAGNTFRRSCESTGGYYYVGIDTTVISTQCHFSVVKHIDRAVARCIGQWLSADGMPKHQRLGQADGYTEVILHPYDDYSRMCFAETLTAEMLRNIHEEAIRKESEYEN